MLQIFIVNSWMRQGVFLGPVKQLILRGCLNFLVSIIGSYADAVTSFSILHVNQIPPLSSIY